VSLAYEKVALRTYLKLKRARIALSGGFATSFYPPVAAGLVQINGLVFNREEDDVLLDGLLLILNRSVVIQPLGTARLPTNADDALQSGPLLVTQNRKAIPSFVADTLRRRFVERRSIRAFIGVDEEDRVLMGLVDEISLTSLIEFLVAPRGVGGLGCTDALNLSGSVNAGLIIQVVDLDFERGDMATPLPTAIVVR